MCPRLAPRPNHCCVHQCIQEQHKHKKGMVKERPKKKKSGMLEEESSKQYLIWIAKGLELDKVAQETTSILGAFASANA
jgi:hypothetical protein